MKPDTMISTSLTTVLLTLAPLALAAGCAAPVDPDRAPTAAPASNETVAETTDALTVGATCYGRPLPPPRTCTLWKCDGDSWMATPAAAGQPCTVSGGGSGACAGTSTQCLALYTGTITPKFYVLSVEYTPPGAASTVDYASGTSWGSTVSMASSWSNAFKVTVKNHVGVWGFGSGNLQVSGEWDQGTTTTDTYDVKETLTTDLYNDGDRDALDHDLDRIYLWLSPQFSVTGYGNTISWAPVAPTDPTPSGDPHVIWVSVGQLLGHEAMNAGVVAAFEKAGITQADYGSILSVDPFAMGGTTIDPVRFIPLETIDYEPPSDPNQKQQLAAKITLTNAETSSTQQQTSVSYKVGASVEGSLGFLGLASVGLKVEDTLTLTSTNTNTATNGTTSSAIASIMQPAYGYAGPIYLDVYVDTIYNTFLFQFEGTSVVLPPPVQLQHVVGLSTLAL